MAENIDTLLKESRVYQPTAETCLYILLKMQLIFCAIEY